MKHSYVRINYWRKIDHSVCFSLDFQHRDRLKILLDECRKQDPSLPNFDCSTIYIDPFGFKHEKSDENERLNLICLKLIEFHRSKNRSIDERLWKSFLTFFEPNPSVPIDKNELKKNVRRGIPQEFRSIFWQNFVHRTVGKIRREKGASYFQNLCHLLPKSDVWRKLFIEEKKFSLFFSSSKLSQKFEKQIALDLNRTMPKNVRFSRKDADGVKSIDDFRFPETFRLSLRFDNFAKFFRRFVFTIRRSVTVKEWISSLPSDFCCSTSKIVSGCSLRSANSIYLIITTLICWALKSINTFWKKFSNKKRHNFTNTFRNLRST